MSLQHEYNAWKNGWTQDCHEDKDKCVCNGHGWVNSPFDTWHKCPVHFDNQRHPESDFYVEREALEVKLSSGETVYQVCLTFGYVGDDEYSETYLHFYEFSTKEKAEEFADKVADRADIETRVQNEYWIDISEPPEGEIAGEELRDREESRAVSGAYRSF